MRALLAFGAGAACVVVLPVPGWPTRTNYRGVDVPRLGGLLLLAPLVAGVAIARGGLVAALAGVAFGALGLADDLFGDEHARGFAGHVRALAAGRVTTGLVKAAGGLAAGVASAWLLGRRGFWLLGDGATIALSANLANLLDLRPGRTSKVWLLSWVCLLAALPPAGAWIVSAAVAGGVVAFLRFDLAERAMLGDTGANLLGAVLGVVAVVALGPIARAVMLGALVALTAASEVVSFSRVIDAVALLRGLDRLGRRSE